MKKGGEEGIKKEHDESFGRQSSERKVARDNLLLRRRNFAEKEIAFGGSKG